MRTFVPVVVRGQEKDGVKFWGFGKTVYQELLGFISDPDYGDLTDPVNGRDIVLEKLTPAEAGNQFGKTTIRVKPNQTPITENKEVLESLFESQVELPELYDEPTYDELKDALRHYLNPENEDAGVNNSAPANATKASTASTADIEDAFDKLFND